MLMASRTPKPDGPNSRRLKDLVTIEGVRDNMLIGYSSREAGSAEEENSTAGSDTYREFAEKYLAQALAESGSFGFARMIPRSVESSKDSQQPDARLPDHGLAQHFDGQQL
jgi:Rod binding domain-containing protein